MSSSLKYINLDSSNQFNESSEEEINIIKYKIKEYEDLNSQQDIISQKLNLIKSRYMQQRFYLLSKKKP